MDRHNTNTTERNHTERNRILIAGGLSITLIAGALWTTEAPSYAKHPLKGEFNYSTYQIDGQHTATIRYASQKDHYNFDTQERIAEIFTPDKLSLKDVRTAPTSFNDIPLEKIDSITTNFCKLAQNAAHYQPPLWEIIATGGTIKKSPPTGELFYHLHCQDAAPTQN